MPGSYTVRVTQPSSGGETFEWFDNGGALAASGSSNELGVVLAAGETKTVSFRIKPSDCCPAMIGSVTLTASRVPPGEPPDGTPPDGTPPDETPPEQPEEPETATFPFCAILRLLIGLALIAALVGGVAAGCAMLLPAAIPTLIGGVVVAVVGALVLLLICRPTCCRLLGLLLWALKWAIVLGAIVAIGCGSLLSAWIVVTYGGAAAALTWALVARGCRIPELLDLP